MINMFFLFGIIVIAILVFLPFILLSRKPKSLDAEISYEILPPGYRRYTIYVPKEYNGNNPVPLILALHYAGQGIPFYGEMILQSMIRPAFEDMDPIIVAPDCPGQYWDQQESEQLILDVLADVKKKYNIARGRTLVTGYSLGGVGTWYYAERFPNHFSAAIVMAGNPPEDVLELSWEIPLMVIHGKDDEIHPVQTTKEVVKQLEESDVDIEMRLLEGVRHYETNYYVAALKNSIPWLLNIWENSN